MTHNPQPDSALRWTNEQRRLSQLIPWEHNPRRIKEKSGARLQDSYKEFGQVEPIAIGPDNELYNGHQRLSTWAAKYGDILVDVRVASRPLTEEERKKLTIYLHAGTTGAFDWDNLSGWNAGDLTNWGLDSEQLSTINEDAAALREMMAASFTYQPMTEPEVGALDYDKQDVERSAEKLADRFDGAPTEYLEVFCPHCGESFFLTPSQLDPKKQDY